MLQIRTFCTHLQLFDVKNHHSLSIRGRCVHFPAGKSATAEPYCKNEFLDDFPCSSAPSIFLFPSLYAIRPIDWPKDNAFCRNLPNFCHFSFVTMGKSGRASEKSTKCDKNFLPKRQIHRHLRLFVAISGVCRYMHCKKTEKNLENEKLGRTFAPAKTKKQIIKL